MGDYDTDAYAWSERQGALLRRLAAGERVNDADLDWPNIAEEIESVGTAHRLAAAALNAHGEQPVLDPNLITFEEAQVLGDWFPE